MAPRGRRIHFDGRQCTRTSAATPRKAARVSVSASLRSASVARCVALSADWRAVRAAYVLVDHGALSDVRSRVERLTGDSEALRFPARNSPCRELPLSCVSRPDGASTSRPISRVLAVALLLRQSLQRQRCSPLLHQRR